MNKALIARSCLENYSAAAAAAATAAQLQPALHIHFVSPLHRDERAAPRPAKAAPNLVPGSALLRAIVCPDHLPPAGLIAGHAPAPEARGGRPRKFAQPPPASHPSLRPLSCVPRPPHLSLSPFLPSCLFSPPDALPLSSLPSLPVRHIFLDSKSLTLCLRISWTLFSPVAPPPSVAEIPWVPGSLGTMEALEVGGAAHPALALRMGWLGPPQTRCLRIGTFCAVSSISPEHHLHTTRSEGTWPGQALHSHLSAAFLSDSLRP